MDDVLWTFTFAAQLVLLVVLLGRDRAGRFPLFTASVALVAFRVLTGRLLMGRLPQITMMEFVIITAVIGVVLGLLVLIELARKPFGRVPRVAWVTAALIVMAIGAVVLKFWGKWPAWEQMKAGSAIQLLQLLAQKGGLFLDVENILVGLLIVIFGARYGAGWRSHTQRIVIGLSTASIAQISVQAIWQVIASHAAPKSMDEYNHFIALRERLFNANSVVFFAVLVWWIITLWLDEPGGVKATPEGTVIEGESEPAALESGSAEALEDHDA
ncbi:hypothetical protein [Occallatibacter riparius]|uniref:Uncharacterized protein n=1 Tax=Occallatibacter riparius TaxID=1002689 RepID=A0A9J7BQJ3_9BACT|nr:hypothetical protein [Occallatibacter riparius]UWZ85075.1 hypothetical protein MOP44_03820 [Occallatibacter riparius]